jgi:photosystem II stability/assembly factor-like uncharacterized protein
MPLCYCLRRLAALAAFLLPLPAAAQGWELLESSPSHGYRFEDGSFINPTTGWIVNPDGEIWQTTDMGESWELKDQVSGYLRSTAFVSETKGWVGVLFSSTQLYETTNGGDFFYDISNRITPSIGGGICGLFAVDAQTVYGVGQWDGPAYVIKTTDGGASWQATNLSPSLARSLIDVYFFDAQHGIAVGGTNAVEEGGLAVVLGTDDGGATWERRFVSADTGNFSEWAWKISFPTPEIGYVSVEYEGGGPTGKVLKTTDGGQTWEEIDVPNGGSMQGIGFITPDLGWTSGRGNDTMTDDGGGTWAITGDLDGSVNRFEFFGDTLGYAMGTRIYRLQRASTADEPDAPPAAAALVSVGPNPSAGAVAVTYRLATVEPAEVAVFDGLGRRVATLASGVQGAGTHRAVWEGAGAAGVYFVRLTAGTVMQALPVVRLQR